VDVTGCKVEDVPGIVKTATPGRWQKFVAEFSASEDEAQRIDCTDENEVRKVVLGLRRVVKVDGLTFKVVQRGTSVFLLR
jgi:hypothetical protein